MRKKNKIQRQASAAVRQTEHDKLTTQQKIDRLKSRYTIRGPLGCEEMMSMKEYRRLTKQLKEEKVDEESEKK